MSHQPVALVTGATSGIGKACVLSLVEAGYSVVAVGRNSTALDELERLQGVTSLNVDITDFAALYDALSHREFDVLVNNAGVISCVKPFQEMTRDEIHQMLSVNIGASIDVTMIILKEMLEKKSGHIFFVGSTAGHAAFPNLAIYGASKAAISSFASSLRCDISGSNIRVTEIVPGRVETNIYNKALPKDAVKTLYEDVDAVQPEDVAQMLLTVLQMPSQVDVTRFDILPTAQFVGGGGFSTQEK